MTQRKKILYIMGIDWDWIFQRPQIIEQYLEEKYDVTTIFPRSILKFAKKKSGKYPRDYRILWTFPWQEKNCFIGWISSLFARRIFRDVNEYDILMIGYPLYYRYILESYKGRVIYDCMDNHEALYPDKKKVYVITKWEKALLKRSDVIFVTAKKLLEKMQELETHKNVILVRNGTNSTVISKPAQPLLQEKYKIGYFGTIAEWFDFGLLEESCKKYSDIEYHLIGPVRVEYKNNLSDITFEGVVQHENLYEFTKDYSCFCMPFIVNDVVEGVDPVKLYEYIAMGKCIISVRYPEIERFSEYVYMYSDYEEYFELLDELKRVGFPPKFSETQQERFLKENSWDKRFEELEKNL